METNLDIDIKKYAEQIKKSKIFELEEDVSIYEKIKREESKNYGDPVRYEKIVDNEINIIKNKINIINKTMKH